MELLKKIRSGYKIVIKSQKFYFTSYKKIWVSGVYWRSVDWKINQTFFFLFFSPFIHNNSVIDLSRL